ncbi:hypothetical protein SFRURICE_015826 [Spodoptera frugiperda]|nr:hypothetical protein SFRURICE_015826 [Spodoptera frugiperda]
MNIHIHYNASGYVAGTGQHTTWISYAHTACWTSLSHVPVYSDPECTRSFMYSMHTAADCSTTGT